MTKPFHLGDIISVTYGILVSPDGIDGMYAILNHLTQDSLFTHQLPRAMREATPWLRHRHPELHGPEMNFRIAELREMLETPSGKQAPEATVIGWLSRLVLDFGEMHEVEPIPRDDHDRLDPVAELVGMVGSHRVVVLDVPVTEV